MAKNLNVSLAFTANTNEAIAAIKNLQKELNGLATGKSLQFDGITQITPEIQKAMTAAGELQAKLEAATNLKTGKLDLGQFSDSLKKGGVSLQQYANQLSALGPAGRQAFSNLASSIIQAEAPLIRCSQRVKELGTTLANTARWQISSSILHGFMGAVQGAYGYAQDLNKSLNDIRIVTGASVAEMDAFAEKANKAARALSTTTNEYAKASLIYFQQGDTQAQAMEKAAVTTKLANVTGQSAEIVSNQLTAIWNNFNKEGDVAYAHFADVLTKLGAATASSTDEIAGGLEKFAGIADTIGLSYEYAASALATITATSRESEEVVGTALKTIFARIQGLKQGETLDDGTNLNKYSEALQKVGISIFDQTGQLKDMDNILEEMADKWVTLSKDQQLALAQTVAGVRQYNQMVTLMDNWDFMEENLATAKNSDGELDKQAEIYAESWEAARDRVRAAAESLYTKLLDDDFFIGFLEGLEKAIDGVGSLVDAFGGLGGVLSTIGAYITRIFQKEMAQGLRTAAHNIKAFINPKGVQAEQDATKAEAIKALRNMKSTAYGAEGKAEDAAIQREARLQEKLYAAAKQLNEEELKSLQLQMDNARAMDKRAISAAKVADAAKDEADELEEITRAYAKMEARDKVRQERKGAEEKARENGTTGFVAGLVSSGRDSRKSGHGTPSKHDFLRNQYSKAVASVKGEMGDNIDVKAPEIQEKIRQAFIQGINDAAEDGSDKVAQRFAQSYQEKITEAGQQAIQAMAEETEAALQKADQEAEAKVAKLTKSVDAATGTQARATDLGKTAAKMSTRNVDGEVKSTEQLAKLNQTLASKIEATTKEALELQAALGGVGKDTGLDEAITELQAIQQELADAGTDAAELDKVLARLGQKNGNKGTVTDQLDESAGELGREIASDYFGGERGPESRGEEYYQASKKKKITEVKSENAAADADGSEREFDEGLKKGSSKTQDWADGIANATSTIMALGSAISSVQGAIDVFNDPDATGWDKVSAIISVIIGVLPVASSLMTMFGSTAAASGAAAGAGMTAALGPIGWIILAVTALIAIFVLLGSAIAANSPEGQLKSAQEATEKTAQAAQNAKSAYEELLSTINRYDSAKESLEGLAKGTDEYTEALMEANAAARELIDTYGLTKFSVDENGLINLDQQELETKKSEHRDRVEDTSSALTGAQKYQNQKEDAVTISNLRQEAYKDSAYYGTDYYNGLINDANISKVLAASREAEGGADAYFAEGKQNIAATMGWDPDALTSYQNDFINALMANSAALNEANAAILANAAANEAATKAQLTQNLSDEEKFQDSEYQNELVEAALNTQGSTEKAADDKLAGMTQDQMYDEYAKMMGYTNNGIGTWLDGKQEFLDKDGNKIELTPEQVKAQMKEMYSQEGMEQNALNLVDTMNKVMARADENKGVISTAITGDTEKLTIGQQGMSADQVAAMVTDEEAQAMGFESAAAFGESFASATENFAGQWQNLMGNYVDSVSDQMQTMFDNGELNNLTLGQSENLANAFETAYATSGQAGMDVLAKMFTDAGEYSDEFANALGTIDWTTATPETLQDALDAAGVATHYTADELNNLINVMNEGAMGFENAANKYKTLSEIVDTLKSGDTITAEQFKELGPGMEDYFMRMADGTYKLIGDAEAFYAAVNEQQMEGFENTITAKTEDNAEIQNVLNHDIGSLGNTEGTNMGGHAYMGGGQWAQNTDVANAQLDFLEQTGYDPAQVQQWRDDMKAGKLDVVDLTNAVNEQTTALGGAAAAEEFLTQQLDANNTEIEQSKEAIASTATSLDELDQMLQDGKISMEAYDKASQGVFEKEVEAEGFDTEELNNYVDALIESGKFLEENREEAQKFALAQYRMEKGCTELVENYKDWDKVLSDNEASLKDINKVMPKVNSMLQDMMDLSDEEFALLPDNFAKDNWDLIQDVYNEVDGAYEALRAKITDEIIMNIGLNDESLNQVQGAVTNFLNNVDLDNIEVGTTLDDSGFSAGLQGLLDSGAVTVSQMNDILSGIGYEPNIEYEEVTLSEAQASGQTGYVQVAGVNGTVETVPVTAEMNLSSDAKVLIPKIGSSKFKGGGGGVADAKAKTGGGGGGGGSKPKKADTVKKQDVVDRYKETDDKLDDIRDKMEDASKAADRLWGPARLEQMKKVNEVLEDEIDALKKKKREAKDNLDIDKQALKDTVKEQTGVTISDDDFDENGNFTQYDEILGDLYDDLDKTIEKANVDGNATEEENEAIQAIQDKIDAVKDAIAQYDETKELVEDLDNEIQDKIYQWQDNNYDLLNQELEFKLDIEDTNLEYVEYYLKKIEDDIYSTAEAFGYMGQQADIYTNKLEAQGDYVAQLEKDYYAGKISLAAYKEGLKESQSATIENLQALQEQKEAMQDYYGNVMEMALEEISLYTDEMEQLNSVLDHYSNILDLVGKQEDYTTKGKVLNAKATNLRNEMQVQQELYEKSNAEAEKWAAKMKNAVEGSNDYETYKKNWIAAQEAANEAQDNMLSKTEEWAEAMKAVVENELAGLAKTMEESLTGGTSFDELLTSMERRSSLQEEYLTTTNQIYETNKLMRQAQQEIDKSSNSVAKRKLQNFINETAQMQEQSELSQYELDIQQAKYDLLLAEIALEEAQNAKSTVRLQRDSEGNFGYVYTADQGAVGEAEQNLADKQNALYNIGLEGANNYNQKYAETMAEAQDAITELTQQWMNGEIATEEEYQRRKAEIQDYYYEKLKQYSSLYQVALTTDSNVIADAWSTDFNDMIYKTDDWKLAVDDYFTGAAESMGTWAEVCGTVLEESGLDDVETAVGNITTKSDELKKTLIGEDGEGGVVGAMMSEVEAAGELSEAYIGIQNEIDRTIAKYEELLKKINEDYTDPNTETVDPTIDTEDEEEDDTTKDDTKTEEPTTPELKVGSMVTVKKNASRWASGESIWNPVKGNNFKVKQIDGEKILIGDPSGPNYSASGITGWIKKTDLEGFATGGYTGEWEGSYGKLAMLHQKELVLNAGDTENFLAGMDLLDKIVAAIDLYSMNSQLSGALSSPSLGNMGSKDVLEQQVHIEASFPGVQDRNEIEEAFNTLINRASQYANRK